MCDLRSAICEAMRKPATWLVLVAWVIGHATSDIAAQPTDPSHQQFLFAYKLLQRGEDKLAGEAFDEYLADFPSAQKRGDAIYYRAMLYRRAGQPEQAIAQLKGAPAPTLVPGYALDLLRGQALSDLGKHKEAAAAFDKIDTRKLKPAGAASVLYLRGRAHRGAENLNAAARDFGAAAKLDSPVRSRALIDLSITQSAMGRKDEAVKTLRQVLALDDTAAPAEAARRAGDLSYDAGNHDQAIEFYSLVINGHPSSPHFGPAVVGSLWTHYAKGMDRRVVELFNQQGKKLPLQDRVQAIYLVGSAQQRLGKHDQAAASFEQITKGDSRYPLQDKALLKLAESRQALGRFDAMRTAIAKLAELYPDSPLRADAAFLLAAADAEQGHIERGAARLSELIDLGPEHPYHAQATLRRARLYETHDQPAAAIADYQAYTKLAPPDAPQQQAASLRLITLLDETGKPAEAARRADVLLKQPKLAPAVEQEAMYRRALALVKANKQADALRQLDALDKKHPLHPYRNASGYYRGLILVTLGKPEDADKPLAAAGGNDQLDLPTRVNAYRVLAAARRDRDDAKGSADALLKLEQLAGKQALVGSELVWLGRYHTDTNNPKPAAAYLGEALKRRAKLQPPLLAAALYETGRMHRRTKQYEKALASLDEVLALGQGLDLDAQLEMARTLADMGQREAAVDLYTALSTADDSRVAATALHESAATWQAIADANRRADAPQDAALALRQARKQLKRIVLLYAMPKLEPMPQQALLELADIADELGETQQRQAELNELVKKYPDSPHARYAKALLAAQRNRLGEAKTLLKQLQGQPMDPPLTARVRAALKELDG